ncbi:MAG TPA: FAD-dependent oxidoreductase, partial [Aggregatilineales bacterium]|nr:FAD-dependent oxidoreductase [Aggregatilineales bacterium]
HHLHDDPFHLRTFTQTTALQYPPPIALYERPALLLFNTHSDSLITRFELEKAHIHGMAKGMEKIADGWRIHTDHTPIDAKRVLLAMGASNFLNIPAWATPDMPVHHVLDEKFNRADINKGQWVVVGGGISGAQTALALAENGVDVTLITRYPIRIHDFDSDPCWVTRLCLEEFYATDNLSTRRLLIKQARYRGSVPYDIADALRDAIGMGMIRHVITDIIHADHAPFRLITTDGREFVADGAILATGFTTSAPIPAWLADAITRHDLPLAPDGYPVVDRGLCWSDGLYVTGALAELEIGATARNIIGARLALERLWRR